MWAIKCLSLLAMLLVPLFVHGQHVQGPCYVVDGKTYAFVSSTNELDRMVESPLAILSCFK